MSVSVRPPAPSQPRLRPALVLVATAAAFLAVLLTVLVVAPAWAERDRPGRKAVEPPPDTVVAVRGDAANGFEIEYADGSALYPPTDSEALAECQGYETEVEQVRCETEIEVWYRELGVLQQALAWADRKPGR